MEAFAAIFKDIYTTFLLRDFAGKIVPGVVLFMSAAALYLKPARILRFVSGEISTALIFFIAGFAWIIVLGLQGLTNAFHVWRYYPEYYGGKPLLETDAQLLVQKFLQVACIADRQQYERFVVIKEATGNLFMVLCISIVLISVTLLRHHQAPSSIYKPRNMMDDVRIAVSILFVFIVMLGLRLMNSEHIFKQYDFAASFMATSHQGCPADEKEAEKRK